MRFVDLFLGDGDQGARDDFLALGHQFSGFFTFACLGLGQSGTELGQGFHLIGFQSLGTCIKGVHGGIVILGKHYTCGKRKSCERDK